jgi:hypothetical protein
MAVSFSVGPLSWRGLLNVQTHLAKIEHSKTLPAPWKPVYREIPYSEHEDLTLL